MSEKTFKKETLDNLALELHRIIDGYRDEHVPYSAILGILDMIKYDIIQEACGDDDED